MIKGKKVVVVMPAYNAARTIEKTWREVLDQEIGEPGKDGGQIVAFGKL